MQDNNNKHNTGRREFLSSAGKVALGAGFAGVAAGCGAAVTPGDTPSSVDYSSLKYKDNLWNRDAWARLMGDLDFGKEKFGWFKGTVNGVREGEKVKPLFGFEGFSVARLVDEGNGSYQKLLREVGFYTDLKTGEVLETFDNPYTGETVKVVPIANDPFNHHIAPFFPEPPSYGGLNKEKPPKIPLLLDWQEAPNNTVFLRTPIHLFYPSALQPEKWPRESAGKMNRVSEMFTYVINRDELADTSQTSITYSGCWSRITPWLPWMLMGQAEGHIYYDCTMGAYHDDSILSEPVRAYAKKHFAKYFSAPEKWEDPSLSSLEHYALEQAPAPVK
ncbi:DUF1838 family protein [Alteromonas sp. 1_MG-2023]|uniref:DUF1838 family protein n=1 Tax=Alteromonas sp. 1_MG-2023 TaxID=3062669 RepID=UPI0026E4869A|nr:DUF1838 family protein [Alteromonas sp. 1_MG-2023]MDO6475131.1 DUF1838 family protein [Alteromonas sp. 1_MG-2023]